MALGFIGAVVALVGVVAMGETDPETCSACVLGLVVGFVLGIAMIAPYRAASDRLAKLRAKLGAKKATAWKQMEPLNRLYTWDARKNKRRGY